MHTYCFGHFDIEGVTGGPVAVHTHFCCLQIVAETGNIQVNSLDTIHTQI